MKPEILQAVIALAALSIIAFTLLAAKAPEAGKHKKKNLLYILAAGLLIGIAGLSRYAGLTKEPYAYFIVLQLLFLVLGILHALFVGRILPWPAKGSIFGELMLTLATALMGGVFLLLAFTIMGMKNFGLIMLSSLIWFLVPMLFIKSVELFSKVPARVFKTWVYPIGQQILDPTDSELASPMVISFEFQKKMEEPDFTIFRAKAPKDIQFGKLFYFFINDYNSRHPEAMIESVAKTGSPYAWVFHFKPRLLVKTRYLDPDETVFHNQVKENSVIVCQRILE